MREVPTATDGGFIARKMLEKERFIGRKEYLFARVFKGFWLSVLFLSVLAVGALDERLMWVTLVFFVMWTEGYYQNKVDRVDRNGLLFLDKEMSLRLINVLTIWAVILLAKSASLMGFMKEGLGLSLVMLIFIRAYRYERFVSERYRECLLKGVMPE